MKENAFTAKVCKVLRSQGAMIYPIIAGAPGAPAGWPDRLVWSRPWRGLLEFKGEATALGKLQRATLRDLCARGERSAAIVRDAGDGTLIVLDFDEVEQFRCRSDQLLWQLRKWSERGVG